MMSLHLGSSFPRRQVMRVFGLLAAATQVLIGRGVMRLVQVKHREALLCASLIWTACTPKCFKLTMLKHVLGYTSHS